uniref:Uncharacterized protein n=1 Tax=Candidozyma auris TaxID=498019 RepID=A0A0L0NYL1_CANAR
MIGWTCFFFAPLGYFLRRFLVYLRTAYTRKRRLIRAIVVEMVFGACGGGASLKMLLYEILVHCAFLGVRFVSLSVLLPTSFFLFFFFFFRSRNLILRLREIHWGVGRELEASTVLLAYKVNLGERLSCGL